jgi:hypothetical protein
MGSFIFVSVVCIGTTCNFLTSNRPITQIHCQEMKTQFTALPFKPEVTIAASQCMEFKGDKEWL